MSNGRLVVVGASSGGVSALSRLCMHLPSDFPAPLCVVLHVGANKSILPDILATVGPLPAVHASDGQRLESGRIFVAPPDHHLRVDGDLLRLVRGPKEHHVRPAIDPLFRSAARSFGARTIGVVLTGKLDDGTPGMQAIKECGGTCVVQDPAEAEEASMPSSVLRHVEVDHCVRLDDLAPLLAQLANDRSGKDASAMPPPDRITHEDDVSMGRGDVMGHLRAIGSPSTFSCPDCSGTLWQLAGVPPQRFLCHTGHAFTLTSLRSAQSLATDEALWSAIRALQEKRELLLQSLNVAVAEGDTVRAASLRRKAELLETSGHSLRALVQEIDETSV